MDFPSTRNIPILYYLFHRLPKHFNYWLIILHAELISALRISLFSNQDSQAGAVNSPAHIRNYISFLSTMTINFHCTACRFKILLKSQFILADGTRFTFGTTYNSVGMMSLFINLINVLRRPSLLRHLLGKACLFSFVNGKCKSIPFGQF